MGAGIIPTLKINKLMHTGIKQLVWDHTRHGILIPEFMLSAIPLYYVLKYVFYLKNNF